MFNANKKYGLVPVVGENYGSAGAGAGITYFGVAVVKKSWCDSFENPTLKSLKVSCLHGANAYCAAMGVLSS